MTIKVAESGVVCCGSCGSELEICCTGGCTEPDVVFRENSVATMAKPGGHFGNHGPYKKTLIRRPGFCAWPAGCDLPVAPYKKGRGRVPIMCPGHMQPSRAKVVSDRVSSQLDFLRDPPPPEPAPRPRASA